MDRVAGRRSFPWLSWAGLISSVCIAVGLYWDISWHEAIGRDTFWTPAHLLIQFGAVLTGLCAGWVILQATFSRDPAYGLSLRSAWHTTPRPLPKGALDQRTGRSSLRGWFMHPRVSPELWAQ